jgi:hypothetical protein
MAPAEVPSYSQDRSELKNARNRSINPFLLSSSCWGLKIKTFEHLQTQMEESDIAHGPLLASLQN